LYNVQKLPVIATARGLEMCKKRILPVAIVGIVASILLVGLTEKSNVKHKTEKIYPSALSDGYNVSPFEKSLDSEGIPLNESGHTNYTGYHPSTICRYGLYIAARYQRDGDVEDRNKIINLVNWLRENKVSDSKFITWELLDDNDAFFIKAPWTSALTNAWCAGALLQGYAITGDKGLERDANMALNYLFTPVDQGGGLAYWSDGNIWFEECPSVEYPSHILNGFIYAIDILDMFNSYYNNSKYDYYYNEAVSALRNKAHLYDVDYGSIYDQFTKGNKLGMSYHKIHYKQLYYIYERTKDEYFRALSQKWFELQMQSDYVVKEIGTRDEKLEDPKFNITRINDGVYWYGYWIGPYQADLLFSFEKPYKISTINIFAVPDKGDFMVTSLFYKEDGGDFVLVQPEMYELSQVGNNASNGNETIVVQLKINQEIKTDSLKLGLRAKGSSSNILVREIGVHKVMSEEYEIETEKYSYVRYISDMRSNP